MMLVPGLIFVVAACLTLITMMLPEDPPGNDDGCGSPTSLRRALLFVLLGPVLGVLVAYYLAGEGYRDGYVIPIAYFFSLIVCATTGPIDGILAHVAPIWLRAPLTAMAGAAVAVGVCFLLQTLLGTKGTPQLRMLVPIAAIGASSTGACPGSRTVFVAGRLDLANSPAPAVPVMNHLISSLNVSFTLSQPKAVRLIAH